MSKKINEIKAGDSFELKQTVGKYTPYFYAGASGDYNPIHIDVDFAKMVGLGGNILQGLCTMAYAARANVELADDPGALKRIKVRFSAPVRPDDKVIVQGTVMAVEGRTATTQFHAVNQQGEEVISLATAELELDE
ncbi:MAG TPA: MaoC/PaaZ C-terminal domain-containing protein [bacterium]|nr:MaoC/PaaZ C-terminal domain-containing protein [bacterium]